MARKMAFQRADPSETHLADQKVLKTVERKALMKVDLKVERLGNELRFQK